MLSYQAYSCSLIIGGGSLECHDKTIQLHSWKRETCLPLVVPCGLIVAAMVAKAVLGAWLLKDKQAGVCH